MFVCLNIWTGIHLEDVKTIQDFGQFSRISPEAKEMNCFEGQRKNTEEKWNFKCRSAELSSSAFHEQESMKKLLVLFCCLTFSSVRDNSVLFYF